MPCKCANDENTFLFLHVFLMVFCQVASGQSSWKAYVDSSRPQLALISTDSLKHGKMYRIWIGYQIIELVQEADSAFIGHIITSVLPLPTKQRIPQFQKLDIPAKTVKILINQLQKEAIETLPDCKKIDGYSLGFDGYSIIVEVCINNSFRLYSYWCPDDQNHEIKEVKNINAILGTLKTVLKLDSLLMNYFNSLPPGTRIQKG